MKINHRRTGGKIAKVVVGLEAVVKALEAKVQEVQQRAVKITETVRQAEEYHKNWEKLKEERLGSGPRG